MTSEEATQLLFEAARCGKISDANAALVAGADVNAKDDRQNTPLHLATAYGNTDLARLLIDSGAEVNAKDDFHMSPLHDAAEYGHTDLARLLIDKGADVNLKDDFQRTPLHWAAKNGHTDLVRLLIDSGAEVNAKDDFHMSPLHCAVENGHTDLARLLIEKGADPDARDDCRQTPLHWAAIKGNTDLVKLLLRHGADPNAKDDSQQTPLDSDGTDVAAWLGQLKQAVSEHFTSGKPSREQCFTTDDKGASRLLDSVLDACVTNQFATLIGAPLIASIEKPDRQLFQDIWDALPDHSRGQNQNLYMQFVKEGGLNPIVGHHTAVADRRGSDEPQIGG